MNVAILAGGFGTRLQDPTTSKAKPMVEIGGKPMLWHIMNLYAGFGHKEFTIALGYMGQTIKDYFLNYYYMNQDLTVRLNHGKPKVHQGPQKDYHQDWTIHLVDTGLETQTGGRLKRLTPHLKKGGTFMVTYGDGIANIDIKALLAFHKRHGKLATLTAVRPPARFGELRFAGDRISGFEEKPQIGEGWINGGFFVLEPEVLDYIDSDETPFERKPLETLARDGELMAYRHPDFWQCMDTPRDVRYLESLWASGQAPWKRR